MASPRHPAELLRAVVDEGRLAWLRSAGAGLPTTAALEQTVVYPAASSGPPVGAGTISVSSFPADLRAIFEASRTGLVSTRPGIGAWEIGNEPDFVFSRDLPDRTASATKAAWLGLRAAGFTGRILMPSLAFRPGPYARELLGNNIAAYSDGWNFHFYGWAQDFGGNIREHRRFQSDLGIGPLPLWITEAGTSEMPGNGSRPAGFLLHRQAAYFERIALEAWLHGVEGFGAFTLSPFQGDGLDYGLTDRDLAPRPAMARYLRMARTLPGCHPLFLLCEKASGDGVGAVILRTDGLWWTVLWTPRRRAENDLPPWTEDGPPQPAPPTSFFPVTARLPPGVRLGTEPDSIAGPEPGGLREFTVSSGTNLHLVSRPGRFEIRGIEWVPWKPAPRPRRAVSPGPVVVQIRALDGTRPDRDGLCHRLALPDRARMEIVGYNFSDRPATGTLRIHAPRGWHVSGATQFSAGIPAWGVVAFPVDLVPGRPVHSQFRYGVSATWTGRDGHADAARLLVAPPARPEEPVEQVAWKPGWIADPPGTEWDPAEVPGRGIRIALVRFVPGTLPGLIAPLPPTVSPRDSDIIRVRLRHHEGLQPSGVRVELVTPSRIVTCSNRTRTLTPEESVRDFRVGDFESAFWSHADPDRRWRPGDIRYVRIQFGGMVPGSTVDLDSVEYLRAPVER